MGIQRRVGSYEWGTFYEDISKGNFQLFSLRWIGVNDPDFYYELVHSSRTPPRGRNRGRFSNAGVDRLLEAGRLEAARAAPECWEKTSPGQPRPRGGFKH